jgi:hypothetical protein
MPDDSLKPCHRNIVEPQQQQESLIKELKEASQLAVA